MVDSNTVRDVLLLVNSYNVGDDDSPESRRIVRRWQLDGSTLWSLMLGDRHVAPLNARRSEVVADPMPSERSEEHIKATRGTLEQVLALASRYIGVNHDRLDALAAVAHLLVDKPKETT